MGMIRRGWHRVANFSSRVDLLHMINAKIIDDICCLKSFSKAAHVRCSMAGMWIVHGEL